MPWSIIHLAVSFLAFGLMARLWACNRDQPSFLTRELADNALYWFINVLFYGGLVGLILKAGAWAMVADRAPAVLARIDAGYGWAARMPLVAQAALIVVAIDIIQYWLHRAFHGRALWPFHAIHHSAEQVDWTTTYRIHPGNFMIYTAGAYALVKLVGFSPAAFVIIGPFNLVMGALAHANVNWTFGPLRYVIASPVFHRWHHVRDPAVRNRNFAPTFPVLDLMFGTFHMPRGELPAGYGVDGVPTHFVGQMLYPFVAIAERVGSGRKLGARRAAA